MHHWFSRQFLPLSRNSNSNSRVRLAVENLEGRLNPSTFTDISNPALTDFAVKDLVAQNDEIALTNPQANASSFGASIGLDSSQTQFSYRGSGYTVAILDTGVDYNHPDLGGGWGKRVVAGYDFVNNDTNPMDDNGHGTHIAGIIGSSSTTYSGVAPQVNFVALKVLDSTANGSWANIELGLQWVMQNRAKYNIVAVNLSLGSGNYTSVPITMLEDEFLNLKTQGMFISVASGNNFYRYNSVQGLNFPAISNHVVSVGAVWTGSFGSATFSTGAQDYSTGVDRIVSMTQRSPGLSILAPGAWITSTAIGTGYRAMAGTSMAAAVVSGSAVLVHEALDKTGQSSKATETGILNILRNTGKILYDGDDENDNVTNTGLSFRRVDLKAALTSVVGTASPPTVSTIADQTMPAGGQLVIPFQASDANGRALQSTVRVYDLATLAYQLDQQYGFKALTSYSQNLQGLNEKWISDRNGTWFAILPNGELRKWGGSSTNLMSAANLIATLDATFHTDPAKLWNATAPTASPISATVVGNQILLNATNSVVGKFSVELTVSNSVYTTQRTFSVTTVAAPPVNVAPTLATIADLTMLHSEGSRTLTLSATDDPSQTLTFSARVVPVSGVTPAVAVAVAGNKLTLDPSSSFSGTCTVEYSVSDGLLKTTKTFVLTVTNTPPSLANVTNFTLDSGVNQKTFAVLATDPENDALTYSVKIQTPDANLYQIDQTYGLTRTSSTYFANTWGKGEKWLAGANGKWYALLPDGNLYLWTGNITTTITSANRIASVGSAVYVEPRLLWDAKPATAPTITATLTGNQLTLTRPAGHTGVYWIEVTTNDGQYVTKKSVMVILN